MSVSVATVPSPYHQSLLEGWKIVLPIRERYKYSRNLKMVFLSFTLIYLKTRLPGEKYKINPLQKYSIKNVNNIVFCRCLFTFYHLHLLFTLLNFVTLLAVQREKKKKYWSKVAIHIPVLYTNISPWECINVIL